MISIFQWIGSTWSVVNSFMDSGTRHQVATPAGAGIVRGTEFLTRVAQDGHTTFGVVSGTVEVASTGGAVVDATAGTAAQVSGDPATAPTVVDEWQPTEPEERGLDTARERRAAGDPPGASPGQDQGQGQGGDDDTDDEGQGQGQGQGGGRGKGR